jgi:hypothetical protein
MSPFGGKPTEGPISNERMQAIGKFFKNGSLKQELVHAYGSPDMVDPVSLTELAALARGRRLTGN